MIENDIYCYDYGSLKWNISKETTDTLGSKKSFGKICILKLRNKRKSLCKSNQEKLKMKEDDKGNGQGYNEIE